MSESTATVKNMFSITKDTPKDHHPQNWQQLGERLKKEVKTIKWIGSISDISLKVAELLDIQIPTIFTLCWKKTEELKKVLEESEKSPDEKFELDLTEHTINSDHNPYIEVSVKNAFKYTIEFKLKMSFTIKGFVLKIKNGIIYQIMSGKCTAEGALYWEELKLLEKKFEPITLPNVISLN